MDLMQHERIFEWRKLLRERLSIPDEAHDDSNLGSSCYA